jgi:hypothetical protein
MMPRAQGGPALAAGPLWYTANEILAFLLELIALWLLGWWGFTTGEGTFARLLLGIGTPAVAVALWGLFAAPRARFRPPLPGVLLVKAVVLGGGAAALYGIGHRAAAVVLLAVVGVNTAVAETSRRALSRGVQET